MNYQSTRLSKIRISVIAEVAELALQLHDEGRNIYDLSVGEPDFSTAPHICAAANDAIARGDTKYPRTQGNPKLVNAVAEQFRSDYGISISQDQILIANGAKQVLFNAFLATLNSGDEVIIPEPYWTSYPDIVRLCDGKVIHTPAVADGSFQPDVEKIEAAITEKTNWLLLNFPSNPSGAIASDETMQMIAACLRKHSHVMLLCDEIYDKTVFDGVKFRTALNHAPDLSDRILIVNGVSKTYAMTGWRIGFALGPARLIKGMAMIQGQTTSGACSISQAAAVAALNGPQDYIKDRCQIYQDRRDVIIEAINRISGLECQAPSGAFYALVSIAGLIGKNHPEAGLITDDPTFCKALLNVEGVATVPGKAFGCPNHIRMSFACGVDELNLAMRHIANFASVCN